MAAISLISNNTEKASHRRTDRQKLDLDPCYMLQYYCMRFFSLFLLTASLLNFISLHVCKA